MHGAWSESDRETLADIIPRVTLVNGKPPKDMDSLFKGMCMPGFLGGLEALMRDASLPVNVGKILQSTYAAQYLIELIVKCVDADKRPYRELISLATTAHKLLLNYFQSPEAQSTKCLVWPSWGMCVLKKQVHCMTRVML